jgi:hypothetical protein
MKTNKTELMDTTPNQAPITIPEEINNQDGEPTINNSQESLQAEEDHNLVLNTKKCYPNNMPTKIVPLDTWKKDTSFPDHIPNMGIAIKMNASKTTDKVKVQYSHIRAAIMMAAPGVTIRSIDDKSTVLILSYPLKSMR